MKPWLGWLPCAGLLAVSSVSSIPAAMLWSNLFPEQAVRFAALMDGANAPIRFFGQCMDQDSKPLSGVRIKMGVRQWRGVSRIDLRGEELKFERVSDANGRFELSGVRGDVAGVDDAALPGYKWIRAGTVSRNFARPRADLPPPHETVILQFWKLQLTEAMYLVQVSNFQGVKCDGTRVRYDLITGSKTQVRDQTAIQFGMVRAPEVLTRATQNQHSDWSFSVEVPGGGVQQTTTNMPFIAPADGYLPSTSLGFKADDPVWSKEAKATYFFRTAEGQYGRLEVWVLADNEGPTASFQWKAYLNPSGSRVLEYDPAKQIKVSSLQLPPPSFQPTSPLPASPAVPNPGRPGAPVLPPPRPAFKRSPTGRSPFRPESRRVRPSERPCPGGQLVPGLPP